MRYFISLSYSGAGFCGWQSQPNAKTIQDCIETALSTLSGSKTSVTGAGRTDTGVNAMGYVAHFDCEKPLDTAQLRYKLNAILPREITIHEVIPVLEELRDFHGGEFHARFSATRREYTYFIHRIKDPFIENFSLLYTFPLDFDKMNMAASTLLGTHDFSCFEKVGSDVKSSICTVREAYWTPYTPSHIAVMGHPSSLPGSHTENNVATDVETGNYWYFRISADRFLRNMVRAIVGSLLDVGRGRRSAEDFARLTLGGSRSSAGDSVSGHALFLSGVDY